MGCGGSMMRTNLQPLARLVDTAAEKWLAVEGAAQEDQLPVWEEITASFRIGDNPELTFHGLRYQLCIRRRGGATADRQQALQIRVHEVAVDG